MGHWHARLGHHAWHEDSRQNLAPFQTNNGLSEVLPSAEEEEEVPSSRAELRVLPP